MMLAFLIDQIQLLYYAHWQAARAGEGSNRALWETVRAMAAIAAFQSWEQLYGVIAHRIPLLAAPDPDDSS